METLISPIDKDLDLFPFTKNTEEVTKNLVRYFPVRYIGSYLLVKEGLLELYYINDIDLLCDKSSIDNIRLYLEDLGFIETEKPYKRAGYLSTEGSLYFVNEEYRLPIHVCIGSPSATILSTKELIANKFERRTASDIKQLEKIISNLKPVE